MSFDRFERTYEFERTGELIIIDVTVETPEIEKELGADTVMSIKTKALIDTGAFSCAISNRLAKRMNLMPSSEKIRIKGVEGAADEVMYYVNLKIDNYTLFDLNTVGFTSDEQSPYEVIIGMNLLKHADYAVSNADGKTVFTIRFPPREKIDFTR